MRSSNIDYLEIQLASHVRVRKFRHRSLYQNEDTKAHGSPFLEFIQIKEICALDAKLSACRTGGARIGSVTFVLSPSFLSYQCMTPTI